METLIGITLAVAAYLVGSVSPSYLLVRFKTGEDVRQTGSRNAGTLNTYHRLGITGGLVLQSRLWSRGLKASSVMTVHCSGLMPPSPP